VTLTPRQKDIAQLVARGMSNRAIAQHTGLGERTVEWYIEEGARRVAGTTPPRHKLTLWFLQLNPPTTK
jgi:DNA-binding NarL/FixJ family response regulator